MKWRKPYPPRRPHWLKGSADWTSAKSGVLGSGSNGYESVSTSHQKAAGSNGSTDWYGFNGPVMPAEFGFSDDARWEDRPDRDRQFPRVPLPRPTPSFWGEQPSGFCHHPYRRPFPENACHAFDGLPPPDFFPHPPYWVPEITESREVGHGSHVNRPFSADVYGSYGTPVGVPPPVFFPETTSPHPPRWAPAVTGTRAMDRESQIDRSRPFSAFAMFAYNASVSPLLLVDRDAYRTLSRRPDPESPVINQHPQAHRDSSEELVKPKHLNELPKNPQPDTLPEVIYLSDDDEQKPFLPMIFTDEDVKVVKVVGPKKKNTVRSGKSTVPIGNFDWSTSTKKTVVTAPSGESTVEDGNDHVTETQSTVQQERTATTTMTTVDALESTVPPVKSAVPTMPTTVGAMEIENTVVASVESAVPTTITTVDAMESTVAPASPSASAIKTEVVDLQAENAVPSTTTDADGVNVDKSTDTPDQTMEQVERRFVDEYGRIHASEGYTVNNYSTMEDEEGGVRTVTVQMVFHKT